MVCLSLSHFFFKKKFMRIKTTPREREIEKIRKRSVAFANTIKKICKSRPPNPSVVFAFFVVEVQICESCESRRVSFSSNQHTPFTNSLSSLSHTHNLFFFFYTPPIFVYSQRDLFVQDNNKTMCMQMCVCVCVCVCVVFVPDKGQRVNICAGKQNALTTVQIKAGVEKKKKKCKIEMTKRERNAKKKKKNPKTPQRIHVNNNNNNNNNTQTFTAWQLCEKQSSRSKQENKQKICKKKGKKIKNIFEILTRRIFFCVWKRSTAPDFFLGSQCWPMPGEIARTKNTTRRETQVWKNVRKSAPSPLSSALPIVVGFLFANISSFSRERKRERRVKLIVVSCRDQDKKEKKKEKEKKKSSDY